MLHFQRGGGGSIGSTENGFPCSVPPRGTTWWSGTHWPRVSIPTSDQRRWTAPSKLHSTEGEAGQRPRRRGHTTGAVRCRCGQWDRPVTLTHKRHPPTVPTTDLDRQGAYKTHGTGPRLYNTGPPALMEHSRPPQQMSACAPSQRCRTLRHPTSSVDWRAVLAKKGSDAWPSVHLCLYGHRLVKSGRRLPLNRRRSTSNRRRLTAMLSLQTSRFP